MAPRSWIQGMKEPMKTEVWVPCLARMVRRGVTDDLLSDLQHV